MPQFRFHVDLIFFDITALKIIYLFLHLRKLTAYIKTMKSFSFLTVYADKLLKTLKILKWKPLRTYPITRFTYGIINRIFSC